MKGRVGTPTVIETVERRTRKARETGWCKRCRNTIYPGEWYVSGKYDNHRYECPDPEEAAQAYTHRLVTSTAKKKRGRKSGRRGRKGGLN